MMTSNLGGVNGLGTTFTTYIQEAPGSVYTNYWWSDGLWFDRSLSATHFTGWGVQEDNLRGVIMKAKLTSTAIGVELVDDGPGENNLAQWVLKKSDTGNGFIDVFLHVCDS